MSHNKITDQKNNLKTIDLFNEIFDQLKYNCNRVFVDGDSIPIHKGLSILRDYVYQLEKVSTDISELDWISLKNEINNYFVNNSRFIHEEAEENGALEINDLNGVSCLGMNNIYTEYNIENQEDCLSMDQDIDRIINYTSKFKNEILQDYEKQIESLSVMTKDNSFKLMEEGVNELYSFPNPFPIAVDEFKNEDISIFDFPNESFQENHKNYSTREYIEVLKTDFENWNELLSKLPTCQSDIDKGLTIMDNYIDEHENSIWRSQFLIIRNGYENYPIDAKMKKLEDSRFILSQLIEDEADDLKNQILSGYLAKINKIIYPEYTEPVSKANKTEIKNTVTELEPILKTKFDDIDELQEFHLKLKQYIKCDLDSWMFWFGGIPVDKPKQIEFLKTIPELLYFVEILCPNDFKVGNRKIKELNQIFKPVKGKKIDSIHISTTVYAKKSAIEKLFK